MVGATATVRTHLEGYLLRTEVRATTEVYYRRVVGVFCRWYGGDVPESDLTADTLNRFLREKQLAGRSSYYRKSLRSGLVAVLRDRLGSDKVRSIRLDALDVRCWDGAEVARLVERCDVLPDQHRNYFRHAIALAYHTGLSQVDLHRVERLHVGEGGTIRLRRSKTGQECFVALPAELLAELPRDGPLLPVKMSREMFRRHFKRVVAAAGLRGTFKTLRASSGTAAELLTGRGHEHLANSRKVFERHYLDRSRIAREPVRLRLG